MSISPYHISHLSAAPAMPGIRLKRTACFRISSPSLPVFTPPIIPHKNAKILPAFFQKLPVFFPKASQISVIRFGFRAIPQKSLKILPDTFQIRPVCKIAFPPFTPCIIPHKNPEIVSTFYTFFPRFFRKFSEKIPRFFRYIKKAPRDGRAGRGAGRQRGFVPPNAQNRRGTSAAVCFAYSVFLFIIEMPRRRPEG